MGFSRQECWSGLPCPTPGNLPNLAIQPMSLMSPALAGRFFTTRTTWEAPFLMYVFTILGCFIVVLLATATDKQQSWMWTGYYTVLPLM